MRSLPVAPSYAKPVLTSRPAADTPALLVAAKEKAAKDEANSRLLKFYKWYENVRMTYLVGVKK